MKNFGGDVIIDTDHYYGISIENCRYLKFTGTGNPNQTYGFKIKRVANGAGLGIGELSSDFEIDHISIENCLIGGLYAKTDPDCSLSSIRGNFTQFNTIILPMLAMKACISDVPIILVKPLIVMVRMLCCYQVCSME
jgi:hypothetical protein